MHYLRSIIVFGFIAVLAISCNKEELRTSVDPTLPPPPVVQDTSEPVSSIQQLLGIYEGAHHYKHYITDRDGTRIIDDYNIASRVAVEKLTDKSRIIASLYIKQNSEFVYSQSLGEFDYAEGQMQFKSPASNWGQDMTLTFGNGTLYCYRKEDNYSGSQSRHYIYELTGNWNKIK